MKLLQFFEEIFGDNIFEDPRTQERTDKRTGSYYYMKTVMRMTHNEIASEIGRNQSTIGVGAKRFAGLLESGDPEAVEIWRMMDDGIKRILAHTDGEILNIDRKLVSTIAKQKNNRLERIKISNKQRRI